MIKENEKESIVSSFAFENMCLRNLLAVSMDLFLNPGMFNQSFHHNMMLLGKETVKLKIKDTIDTNLSRKRILVSWSDC